MSGDYISRIEAIMAVTRAKLPDVTENGVPIANGKRSVTDCVRRIKDIPAADVRPVVKEKWEWNDNNGYYYCGNCKAVSPREDQYGEYIDCPNFCPNCGARMEGPT